MLDLHLIRIDGGTQSRANLNEEAVAEYAEAYKAGADFPAVTVFFDGKDRWLADGFHRYFAAKKAGNKTILEKIIPGTRREAVLYSLGANGTHGLNRTNADKRNAVATMLADPEWAKWSDNAIAKACGVSQPFVGSVRPAASYNGLKIDAPATRTVERNGKTYEQNTANIGKPATPPAKSTPAQYNDDDEGAPDDDETASVAAAEKVEVAAMNLLLASDAPLADVTEKYKQSLLVIERLNARIVGLQNQSLHQISEIKRLKKKLERVEQAA